MMISKTMSMYLNFENFWFREYFDLNEPSTGKEYQNKGDELKKNKMYEESINLKEVNSNYQAAESRLVD